MSKWIIRVSFTATWTACWPFLIAAESPVEWFVTSLFLIVTPLVYIPMLEAVEDV